MLKLREVMTTDVLTLTPDTSLRDAADLLSRRHVSGAPVLLHEGIVGVVSTTDLLSFIASNPGAPTSEEAEPSWADWNEPELETELPAAPDSYFTESLAGEDAGEPSTGLEGPEWDILDEHTVEEVMTRKLWALTPDDDVAVAASLMDSAGIHRVIVAEQGKLAGVVTTSDIARVVGKQQIQSRTFVFTHQPEFDERGTE